LSSKVSETVKVSLQEYFQDKFDTAVGDLSTQVVTSTERKVEKLMRTAQSEAQAEAREDALQFQDDLTKITSEAIQKNEKSMRDMKRSLDIFANDTKASVESLSSETIEVRRSFEEHKSHLIRSFEEHKSNLIPSLRDLQSAIVDERQGRTEFCQHVAKKMQALESGELLAAQRSPSGRGIADFEAAVSEVQRRLAGVEETMENRLHELIHTEVMRSYAGSIEDHQRAASVPLVQLEGKMDRIVRGLHTPSGRAGLGPPASDAIEDREMWRQRFRSSLGDSLYVKKAIQNGGRSQSTGDIHGDRRRSRR